MEDSLKISYTAFLPKLQINNSGVLRSCLQKGFPWKPNHSIHEKSFCKIWAPMR